jgi:hypothetical protein
MDRTRAKAYWARTPGNLIGEESLPDCASHS